ncbi:hypothetical protein FACS189430_06310 [Bacteroidia bacterium]|nr:hypothetical protein FACS189430_06310 [Bacteroidia bacterium]
MKNLSLMVIGSMLLTLSVHAQKVTQGSLKFLKGETALNFAFDYSNLKVNGKPEQAYIDAEVAAKNAKEAGNGDLWQKEWVSAREEYYQPKVIDYFNQHLKGAIVGGQDIEANYTATVRTLQTVPGYMAGPYSKAAVVTAEIIFTKTGSNEVLAIVLVKNAKTNGFDLSKFVLLGQRIGSAYGYVGQNLAMAVLKAVK